MKPERDKRLEIACANSGEGSLKAAVLNLAPGEGFRVFKRTYFGPEDFYDNRYDPAFSPILYPGQAVTLRVKQAGGCCRALYAAAYAEDAHSGLIEGERVRLTPGAWQPLRLDILGGCGLIREAGVRIVAGCEGGGEAVAYLDEVRFSGNPDYVIDFRQERMEVYSPLHREVSQFTYLKGIWALDGGRMAGSAQDYGEAYTGDIAWGDYRLTGSVTRGPGEAAALLVRVQGAIRCYAVVMREDRLSIEKNDNGYSQLASHPLSTPCGQTRRLTVEARGDEIRVLEGGELLLSARDGAYRTGCVGLGVYGGCRAYFDDLAIEPPD